METPTRNSCIIPSFLLLLVIGTIVLILHPQTVQGAKDSCPLKPGQKARAVKAFKGLAPIFQEARCLNCHGAVNPFFKDGRHGGGYIDTRAETKRFLSRPDLQGSLTTGSDPTGAITAKTMAGLKEIAESPSEITDNDLIRQKAFDPMRQACKECHISSWIIPMRHNHFVGRSAKDLCAHMKTSILTNEPGLFLRHMQDDELVLEGFKGRKGLLDGGGSDPPAMSFATVEKHANEWVEAMGGKFHRPPDCGCVVHGDYVLEFQSKIVSSDPYGDPAQSQASAVIRLEATEAANTDSETKYIGQGIIVYRTGPLPNWEPCTPLVRGQGLVPMRVFQSFIHIEEPSSESATSPIAPQKSNCCTGSLGGRRKPPRACRLISTSNVFPIGPNRIPFGLLTTSVGEPKSAPIL